MDACSPEPTTLQEVACKSAHPSAFLYSNSASRHGELLRAGWPRICLVMLLGRRCLQPIGAGGTDGKTFSRLACPSANSSNLRHLPAGRGIDISVTAQAGEDFRPFYHIGVHIIDLCTSCKSRHREPSKNNRSSGFCIHFWGWRRLDVAILRIT